VQAARSRTQVPKGGGGRGSQRKKLGGLLLLLLGGIIGIRTGGLRVGVLEK
jgi:hypothetical protein